MGGLVGALRQRLSDLSFSRVKRQNDIGLAVVNKVRNLPRSVIRIDRHAAYADAVQGQLMKDVLGTVLQQSRHAVAKAIARHPIDRREFINTLAGIAVGELEARGQIAASVICWHR